MLVQALLGLALADIPVTSLKDDYRPKVVQYERGELNLDGVIITGKRSDKRYYLEVILPTCPAAAPTEQARARRLRVGSRLAMGGVAIVLGASALAPALAPVALVGIVATGGAVGTSGAALALSGASMQRSIEAYNACMAEKG